MSGLSLFCRSFNRLGSFEGIESMFYVLVGAGAFKTFGLQMSAVSLE